SGASGASEAGDSAALFVAVQADLSHERGPAAWLRGLPTRNRLALAAVFSAALVATIGVTLPRSRFGPMPPSRVVLVVTVLAAVLALTLRLALRPLQAAPLSRTLSGVCFAAGLVLPLLFAAGPFPTEFALSPGVSFVSAALGCFLLGAITGGLVVVLLRALDRGAHGSRRMALLAATAGGLAANAALELHCPVTAPAHLLVGHAAVALALVLFYGAFTRQSSV
ncbi:MAG TPA: hypothetical protein VF395_03215, partial [Polyangiaceae bacterium]